MIGNAYASVRRSCEQCGHEIEEGLHRGQPPIEAKYCLRCRSQFRRRANLKHVWKLQYEEYLKANYYGGLNRRFRVLNRTTRETGLPRWYIKKRAASLGLTMHQDKRPWKVEEEKTLERLLGKVSALTIAKRLGRTEALESEGYLSKTGQLDGQQLYETTVSGNQLAGANLRPISRVTAEKKLRTFIDRVHAANSNPDYLEMITGVIVFGSFLSETKELGDVDVGIQLERKAMSDEVFLEGAEARRKLAQERGKRFRNLSEWVTWPTEEIRVFLKSRARQLSIHEFRELKLIPPFKGKILLGERRALAKTLSNAHFVD